MDYYESIKGIVWDSSSKLVWAVELCQEAERTSDVVILQESRHQNSTGKGIETKSLVLGTLFLSRSLRAPKCSLHSP